MERDIIEANPKMGIHREHHRCWHVLNSLILTNPIVPRTFTPRRSTRFRQWKHVPLNFDTNTVKHVWRSRDMTERSVTDDMS